MKMGIAIIGEIKINQVIELLNTSDGQYHSPKRKEKEIHIDQIIIIVSAKIRMLRFVKRDIEIIHLNNLIIYLVFLEVF